jgi:hypothetical protein
MTMTKRDKVFAQNWIEQMREDFAVYHFSAYVGQPLTYVYEYRPDTYVNCFWWDHEEPARPWGYRDNALSQEDLVR